MRPRAFWLFGLGPLRLLRAAAGSCGFLKCYGVHLNTGHDA